MTISPEALALEKTRRGKLLRELWELAKKYSVAEVEEAAVALASGRGQPTVTVAYPQRNT